MAGFAGSSWCTAWSKDRLEVSFLADKAILACLDCFSAYFGYSCGSDLDLVLRDALASCWDIRVREGLWENQEEEHGR